MSRYQLCSRPGGELIATRLTHRAREGDHLDSLCAGSAERRGGGRRRRPRRIDVVDEDDTRRRSVGDERAPYVSCPQLTREPGLACPGRARTSPKHRRELELPSRRERVRQLLCRMRATPKHAVAIGGHECDRRRRGSRDAAHDELGCQVRCAAEAVLFPRGDQRPDRAGVGNRGPRRSEAEPAAAAFAAPRDRPERRCAAKLAPRRRKLAHRAEALLADEVRCGATGDAARGKEEFEQPLFDRSRSRVTCE